MTGSKLLAAGMKKRDEALGFISSISTRHDALDNMPLNSIVRRKGGRAFARPDLRAVAVAHADSVSAWVHEIGHIIEHSTVAKGGKPLLDEAKRFLAKRAAADPAGLQRLRDIFPKLPYHASETAWKDNFMTAYMGKSYKDATELVSMGIEYLHSRPVQFAKRDPEMFDWIVDILRGHRP